MPSNFNIIATNPNRDPIAFRKSLSVISTFSRWGPFIWQDRIYETGDIEMRQWRNNSENHYNSFVNDVADVIRGLGYEVECRLFDPVTVMELNYWMMITMIKKNDIIIYGDDVEHHCPIMKNTHPLSGNNRLLIDYELRNYHRRDTNVILSGEKLADPEYYDNILTIIENGSSCNRSPQNLKDYKKYLIAASTIGNTLPNDISRALWQYSVINELCDREIEFYIPDCMMEDRVDSAVPCSEDCQVAEDYSLHTRFVTAPNNDQTNIHSSSNNSSSSDDDDDGDEE